MCGVPPPALRLHVPYSRSSWTIRYCIEGARWRGVNGNLCLWSTAPLSAVQQLQELTNQQLAGSVYHRVHYHAASPLTNPRLIHAQALTLLWYDYDDAKGPVNNFVSVCDTANLLDYKIFSVLCRHSVSILRAHPYWIRVPPLWNIVVEEMPPRASFHYTYSAQVYWHLVRYIISKEFCESLRDTETRYLFEAILVKSYSWSYKTWGFSKVEIPPH